MTIAELPQHIDKHILSKKPFVAWRMPHTNQVQFLFQKDDIDYRFAKTAQSGFIASDFLQSHRYFIPEDQADALFFPADHLVTKLSTESSEKTHDLKADKEHYFSMLDQAIHLLKSNELQKVVLSHPVKIKSDKEAFQVFIKLLEFYPAAYVYLWYHPETGIWLGATPEILIDIENQELKTMALAGTQAADAIDKVVWQAKEIQEQQYVVDAMQAALNRYTESLSVSERQTVQAGNLFHLKTDFKGKLQKHQFTNLLKDLHPTSAVCGIPRETAKKFINQYEGYKRNLYTGYLGYISVKNDRLKTKLQVNLRCMQKNSQGYTLFAGGGITADSNPQQEWEETLAKAQTMLQAL